MDGQVSLEQVMQLARRLPLADKVRLIEKMAPQIQKDLQRELRRGAPASRRSLRGLWRGLDISPDDIDQARREMWSGFPREDI